MVVLKPNSSMKNNDVDNKITTEDIASAIACPANIEDDEEIMSQLNPDRIDVLTKISKEDIDVLAEDEKDFIGSQGQIYSEFSSVSLVGSGMLFIQKYPEGLRKQFVLTCAHCFVRNDKKHTQSLKAQTSTFYYRQPKEKKGQPCYNGKSELSFYVHEKYQEDQIKKVVSLKNFYNNIAIAICESDLSMHIKPKEIYIMDLEKANAKQGDKICVVGYPHDRNDTTLQGTLCYMEGTIKEIRYNPDNKDEAIILYNDIETLQGQAGAPIYLKYNDTWVVIGVHVGSIKEHDKYFKSAVAITRAKKSWMMDTVDKLSRNS